MDEELNRRLASVLRILHSIRWFLPVAGLVGALIGQLVTGLVTPRYVSQITVSLKDQDVFNNLLKDMVAPVNTKTSTASAQALLGTAPVLDRVSLKVGLIDSASTPEARVAVRRRLQTGITVKQTGSESGLFTITATASTGENARDVATAFGREFLRETASLRIRTAKLALGFLREQMDKTGAQLEVRRKEIAEYRSKNLFSLPDFALDGTINLLQLRKDQVETASKLAQARKRIELIRAYYRKADPRLAGLQAELSEVRSRRERLRADFTPQHPVMRELEFQERQLKRLISSHRPDTAAPMPRDRITVQLGSDGKPGYSASPGDAFLLGRQFQEQDLLLEAEMLEVRQSQIDSLLSGLKGGLEQIPELQRVLAQKQAEIDRLEKSFEEIRSRWNDAEHSIEIGILDSDAEFAVVSPATLPDEPVYPVASVFLLAGVVLGVLGVVALGVGVAWFRGRVRDVKDLEEDLGVPCLGVLPDLSLRTGGRP